MNKLSFVKLAKDVKTVAVKHSPEILMGFGIASSILTTVLAVKATPKALKLMDKKKKEEQKDKLAPVETVKATWKCYIPAAVSGVMSVSCLVGSSAISLKRGAALAAAYKLSETALAEYKDAVVETIGEKKEQVIQEKAYQKQIENNPVEIGDITYTGNGDTLCMDPLTKRYFYSSVESIRRAENAVNKQMLRDILGTASLNDFYDELGIDRTDIGYVVGWNTDCLVDLDIYPGMYKDKPCVVVGHHNPPKWEY